MSASQRAWTITDGTNIMGDPLVSARQTAGPALSSGDQVEVVPAEQLQVAVEALAKAKRALEVIADDKLSSLRLRDSNCVRYFADDALTALGESQEEM